jgi:hypothetical protein
MTFHFRVILIILSNSQQYVEMPSPSSIFLCGLWRHKTSASNLNGPTLKCTVGIGGRGGFGTPGSRIGAGGRSVRDRLGWRWVAWRARGPDARTRIPPATDTDHVFRILRYATTLNLEDLKGKVRKATPIACAELRKLMKAYPNLALLRDVPTTRA